MSTTTSDVPAAGTAPLSPRDRILEAASELFYALGIRAVSADKIIDRAGITKVTFYRHFPTKDDLVVAYLERRSSRERQIFDDLVKVASDETDAFRRFAQKIGTESCRPGFRGCPFINAAAEYADPDSAVRTVVTTHRAWYRDVFTTMLHQLGATNADEAADELLMLRDGAMLAGYLGEAPRVTKALTTGILAVLGAHDANITE